jgi:hypothetical protein
MSKTQVERPLFYEGQYLGSKDLTAAVDYARTQDARHNLGAHTWGIAMGLELFEKKDDTTGKIEVYLQPGYAWDGYGRPIVVLFPYKLPPAKFKSIAYDATIDEGDPEGRLIEIWVGYSETETSRTPSGFADCDTDAQYSRAVESFVVHAAEQLEEEDQKDNIIVAGYSIPAKEALQKLDASAHVLFDESVPYQGPPMQECDGLTKKPRWFIPAGYVRWKPDPQAKNAGVFIERTADDLVVSRRFRKTNGVVAGAVHAADDIIRMRSRANDYSSVWSEDLVWVEGKLRVDDDARLFDGRLIFLDEFGGDNDHPLYFERVEDNGIDGTDLALALGEDADGKTRLVIGPVNNDAVEGKTFLTDDGKIGLLEPEPARPLTIRGIGDDQDLIGFEDPDGIPKWHISQNPGGIEGLNFAETDVDDGRLFLKPGGDVGIHTTEPTNRLHVDGSTGIRQNSLYVSGGEGWSSVSYNAHHNSTNGAWVFPDPSRKAVTIEMDDHDDSPRFQVYSTTNAAPENWIQRFAIDGESGDVHIAHNGGQVGIGTNTPADTLDVRGNIKLGFGGELFAVGSPQNVRVVAGYIDLDGNILFGEGFSATRNSQGSYTIGFTDAFLTPPAIVVTASNPVGEDNVANVSAQTFNGFNVSIIDAVDDDSEDSYFSFIAIGGR